MKFALTNQDRTYLGLEPIADHWDKVKLTDEIDLYFDGNIIKKSISVSTSHYREKKMHEETDNREILLPKTTRGKPKKLNFSAFQARNGIGTYFEYSSKSGVLIGNYTTQKTFYDTSFEQIPLPDFATLRNWLNGFIQDSTEADVETIQAFGRETRQRVKIKEGDFFRFKVDRRNYGFGQVLLDIRKLIKDKDFKAQKNYGLTNLMGQNLTIKIYHAIADKTIPVDELKQLPAFPAQHIMDNRLFYGEFEVIGHQPLESHELDFPMSYSKSISSNENIVYFQWGLIYRQISQENFNKYLAAENPFVAEGPNKHQSNPYRNEGTGFSLDIDKPTLEKCIQTQNNQPYWDDNNYNKYFDLRNPANEIIKAEIFQAFGLDPDLSYQENLQKTPIS